MAALERPTCPGKLWVPRLRLGLQACYDIDTSLGRNPPLSCSLYCGCHKSWTSGSQDRRRRSMQHTAQCQGQSMTSTLCDSARCLRSELKKSSASSESASQEQASRIFDLSRTHKLYPLAFQASLPGCHARDARHACSFPPIFTGTSSQMHMPRQLF